MAEIVNSLFGGSPADLFAERNRRDYLDTVAVARQSAAPGTMMSPSLAPFYQEAAQAGQMIGRGANAIMGLLGVEDPEMRKLRDVSQLRTQFDLTTPGGIRQYARALNEKGYGDFAVAASTIADQRERDQLNLQKTRGDITKTEQVIEREDKLREELAKLPANATDEQVIAVVSKYGSPDAILRVRQDSLNRKATAAAKKEGAGIGPLTPAQKAADTAFAKDYNDFVAGGGITTIQKNLADLDKVIAILESKDTASGKTVGLADAAGTLSYLFPKAAEAKDLLGGVAQSNLRQILGGQFAAKEGEQLLARAYNVAQPQADNLRRVKSLRKQIEDAAAAKIQAVQQFEQYGTLKGLQSQTFNQAASGLGVPSENDPLGIRNKPKGK